MTNRGLILCDWWDLDTDAECEEHACWWDEAPPRTATASQFWCDKHHPKEVEKGFERFNIKQDIIQLEDGGEIWYPSFLIKGEWRGWGWDNNFDLRDQGIIEKLKTFISRLF